MIVSINQPAYLPWLGYFDRIYKSDLHIILDDVQFEKNSVTNRNKIRTYQGWNWLTVPILTKGNFGDLVIKKLEINNSQNWQKKHYGTLMGNYSKSAYITEHKSWLEDFYRHEWKFMGPLLDYSIEYLMQVLNITTPILKASLIEAKGKKSNYILNLCREAGATTYLSGPFGRDYLDLDKFTQENIKIKYHDYEHPKYCQLFGEFLPYMSVIDLIFNEGSKSLEILTGELKQ